jgi:hypothetical protein
MASLLPLMTQVITQKQPVLAVMRGITKKVMKGHEKCNDLSLTTTSPLRVCTAELSELVLGCPAWHSASPWDACSGLLVQVYSTVAPMHLMGASFPTTPTSSRLPRVPHMDRKPPAIVSRGTSGSFSSGSCPSGYVSHLASSLRHAVGATIG